MKYGFSDRCSRRKQFWLILRPPPGEVITDAQGGRCGFYTDCTALLGAAPGTNIFLSA